MENIILHVTHYARIAFEFKGPAVRKLSYSLCELAREWQSERREAAVLCHGRRDQRFLPRHEHGGEVVPQPKGRPKRGWHRGCLLDGRRLSKHEDGGIQGRGARAHPNSASPSRIQPTPCTQRHPLTLLCPWIACICTVGDERGGHGEAAHEDEGQG